MVPAHGPSYWMGQPSGPSVFCFECPQTPRSVVRVLGSYFEDALMAIVARHPGTQFRTVEIPLGGGTFHLAFREGVKILEGGTPSNSRGHGSGAIYLAEWQCDTECEDERGSYNAFKVYILPPNCTTSPHSHLKHWESFNRIAGPAPFLRLGLPTFKIGENKRPLRNSIPVNTNISHQLVTAAATVLILVGMRGPDPLRMWDHHYDE